jgi:hypothetical protein
MEPNLEYDLLKTDWIVQKCKGSLIYSQNLYAALCNNTFCYGDDEWGCSWRMSGGIVADIRDCGETYIDWYCSGMSDKNDFVGESFITDEIRLDLLKIGWTIKEEKNATFADLYYDTFPEWYDVE